MDFTGFNKEDFQVFYIDGLEPRMDKLRHQISPKLESIGKDLSSYLSVHTNEEIFYHVARHARRTKNPPNDTWVAWSNSKRGYKSHPHFQVGLFDDFVFIWLAYIYELPNKTKIAQYFLDHMDLLKSKVPNDFVISLDHTKKESTPLHQLTDQELIEALKRFRDVKKAEFLIGQHVNPDNPILYNGNVFLDFVRNTFEKLIPLYQQSSD